MTRPRHCWLLFKTGHFATVINHGVEGAIPSRQDHEACCHKSLNTVLLVHHHSIPAGPPRFIWSYKTTADATKSSTSFTSRPSVRRYHGNIQNCGSRIRATSKGGIAFSIAGNRACIFSTASGVSLSSQRKIFWVLRAGASGWLSSYSSGTSFPARNGFSQPVLFAVRMLQ